MFGQDTNQQQGDQSSQPSAPQDQPAPAVENIMINGSLESPATQKYTYNSNDLASIKQDALNKLSPLVSQLDQTPEEKFKTTMMMIQASDNQTLIPDAYAAAQAITDEKAKAQALLDIINEINYFTQHAA